MNWLDYVLIIIVALGAVRGFSRGLVRSLFALGGTFLGVYAGFRWSGQAAVYADEQWGIADRWAVSLSQHLPNPAAAFNIIPSKYQAQVLQHMQGLMQVDGLFDFGDLYLGLAFLAVEVIAFLVLFALVSVGVALLGYGLEKIFCWGPVAGLNRLAGAAFGALLSAFILMIIFGLIAPFIFAAAEQGMFGVVRESQFAVCLIDYYYFIFGGWY